MPIQEAVIDHLEAHIPELAESAVTQAYWQTLASGQSVVTLIDGVIFEVFPDGTRKKVKDADPSFPIAMGAKREIK